MQHPQSSTMVNTTTVYLNCDVPGRRRSHFCTEQQHQSVRLSIAFMTEGIGAVVGLVQILHSSIQTDTTNKAKTRRIHHKCGQLINSIHEDPNYMPNDDIRAAIDELRAEIMQDKNRSEKLHNKSLLKRLRDGFSIGRKTDDIESRLNAAIDAFKVRTQLNTNRVQSEMQGDMRYNFAKQHDDMVDIHNLLIQVIKELGIARQIGVDESLQSPKGQDLAVGMAAGPLGRTSQKTTAVTSDLPPSSSCEFLDGQSEDLAPIEAQLEDMEKEIPKGLERLQNVFKSSAHRRGRLTTIYKGEYNGVQVAMKSYNFFFQKQNIKRRGIGELHAWFGLDHENVVKLLGFDTRIENAQPKFFMICSWFKNGHAIDYLDRNPRANRLSLMRGAAQGLAYIHSRNIPLVHGNINCENILVSDKGEGVISNFSTSNAETSGNEPVTENTSDRYSVPELHAEYSTPNHTVFTDIWQFGSSILRCMSDHDPYDECKRTREVLNKLRNGMHPARPSADRYPVAKDWLTDEVWDLLVACWNRTPQDRIPMVEVAARLKDMEAGRVHFDI